MILSHPATRFFIASGCPIVTTSLYRATHLCQQLQALGHQTAVHDWFDEATIQPELARDAEVIVLYRLPMSDPLQQVIQEARNAGKLIIFDTDDLIFEPELTTWHRAVQKLSPADQAQHLDGVRRYLMTLIAADAVTVVTPVLAELAQKRGKPAYVHRNALGDEMEELANDLSGSAVSSSDRERVIVGYGSGTATHDIDFLEAAPALLQVLGAFANVELWIAGPLALPESFTSLSNRTRRFPLSAWQDWFRLLAKMDIALAPLERNNIFCRAKSEIKFVEAGALGVPVIASRVGAYCDAITDGVNGYLASNETEWVAALRSLIQDRSLRLRMGQAALLTVRDRYGSAARTGDLQRLLTKLGSDLGK
jgi:glycosyltransferase involved in cell wall biosynthesis